VREEYPEDQRKEQNRSLVVLHPNPGSGSVQLPMSCFISLLSCLLVNHSSECCLVDFRLGSNIGQGRRAFVHLHLA
jgi:hypothetical protein